MNLTTIIPRPTGPFAISARAATLLAALAGVLPGAAWAQWQYDFDIDPMTSKKTVTARLESTNQLNLEFPYKGKNYGTLFVRQSPRHGLDVALMIEKGQLICGYDDCYTAVRFDDAPMQKFEMARAADGSSTVIFFRGAKRFIDRAVKAKEIRIAATVYQAGQQIIEFKVSTPLEWPPALTKPAPAAAPAKPAAKKP